MDGVQGGFRKDVGKRMTAVTVGAGAEWRIEGAM
jgi:hypothetical protein